MKIALLLVLGATAGLLVRRLQPDAESPPARMAAPVQPAEQTGPDPLAHRASAAALASKTAQAEAPAPRLHVQGPREELPAELVARVQHALSNGTPVQALSAAQSIALCVEILTGVERLTAAGLRGIRPQDVKPLLSAEEAKAAESMGITDANAVAGQEYFERSVQRCQALDAYTLAQRDVLLERAYKGGAPAAAGAYLSSLARQDSTSQIDAKLLERLRSEVRAEANAGQFLTLASFSSKTRSMALAEGFSAVEHWAYREAYFLIAEHDQPGSASGLRAWATGMEQASWPGKPPTAPLTQQQQAQASALAKQIFTTHFKSKPG